MLGLRQRDTSGRCDRARASEAAGFFRSVARSLGHAREDEDLADGFMRLSTSAFLGFRYSRSVATLLDRILESAQRLSNTLSVSEPQPDSHHSSN